MSFNTACYCHVGFIYFTKFVLLKLVSIFWLINWFISATKGILLEQWYAVSSLQDVKLRANTESPASQYSVQNLSHFWVTTWVVNTTIGFRMRTFFLSLLSGAYHFSFSCHEACEWVIKEAENSSVPITRGNSSSPGMTPQEFKA